MTKLKTLVHASGNTSIGNIPWIKEKMSNYFNIEPFDPTTTYHPSTHIILIDRYDSIDSGWHVPFKESGFKVIVEYFWDSAKDETPIVENEMLYIRARDWVWIDGYLMRQHDKDRYRPQIGNPNKFFLMLMNLGRDTRDRLFDRMTPYLEDSLYSYRARGITIEGDYVHWNDPTFVNQHFLNPLWYHSTNFSLVAETLYYVPKKKGVEELFVSEKTFKPILMNHPFIVHGSAGTLDYLHGLGFQTFDHIIDESYDRGENLPTRVNAICSVLETLYKEFKQGKILFSDSESRRRLDHNVHRYYDSNVVDQLIKTQILDVIQEFVDA
jgi:hypothetical protein